MKDLLGNRISKGSLLWWKSKDMMMVVADASEGGLELGDSKQVLPPTITLQVTIPINLARGVTADTCTLQDFLCLVNPQVTAAVEGMMTQ